MIPAKVETLRGKLTSLGVFNAVRIQTATTLDANGELPFDVGARPTARCVRSVSASRPRRSAACGQRCWTHRNLFGQARA